MDSNGTLYGECATQLHQKLVEVHLVYYIITGHMSTINAYVTTHGRKRTHVPQYILYFSTTVYIEIGKLSLVNFFGLKGN